MCIRDRVIIEPPAITCAIDGQELNSTIYVDNASALSGDIQINSTGGMSPYVYSISPNVGTHDGQGLFSDLPVGSYTVTVSDGNNCSQDCINIEVVDGETISCEHAINSDVDVCVESDAIYIYSNPVPGQFQIKGNLGDYLIVINDSNGNIIQFLNSTVNYQAVDFDNLNGNNQTILISHKSNQNLK